MLLSSAILGMLAAGAAQTVSERQAQVDAVFSQYAKGDVPGCAVAISERGRSVYANGYGMADLAWSVPITPQTRFDIASDAKQFTAFAVALLDQRRALSLDDEIRKFIPELKNFGQRITLRQMLGMRSGLPDFLTLGTITGRRGGSKFTPEVALRLVSDIRSLDFEPGSDWTYSNTNFLLLALAVERVSGKPLGEFLEAEAFRPAGMTRTSYEPDPQPVVKERATPYAPGKGGFLMAPIQHLTAAARVCNRPFWTCCAGPKLLIAAGLPE
jgi:CubicO group peptidase (beta-lactamase class C family)